MAAYWKTIRAQAWAETKELVRLDQWGRIVLWLALLGATAGTAPTLIEGGIRVLAVVGATALVGVGIYLVKLAAIPPRLAASAKREHDTIVTSFTTERDQLLAKVRDLETPRAPARDPDGIYQWDEKVGDVQQVRQEIEKGQITFGLLSVNMRWSKDHTFQYRSFNLKFDRCDGGSGTSHSSVIGGVEVKHSSQHTLRNVVCTIVD